MKKGKILVIEDQEQNCKKLREIFEEEYEIMETADSQTAIDLLKEDISVVLLNVVMAELEGYDVLQHMSKKDIINKIPVIAMIPKYTTGYVAEKVLSLGVSEIIEIPYTPVIVQNRVKNVLELKMDREQLHKTIIEQTNSMKIDNKRLRAMNFRILSALGTIVEFRNMEFDLHIERVFEFTRLLLDSLASCYPEYHLTSEEIESISYASATHDIGKIAVPDRIILKPGRLTEDEYKIMRMHTIHGNEIIEHIASEEDKVYMQFCLQITRSHHERFDGRGYPDGLVGENIPIAAQVVSLADVYDALVSDKVYKAAYTHEEAFRMILDGDCGVFNPKLLSCFKITREGFEKISNKLQAK